MSLSLHPSGLRIPVALKLDVFDFRRAVRNLALRHGFNRKACGSLELIASELGTNIVKHGGGGVAEAYLYHHPDRGTALRIQARDVGPEIRDLQSAVIDGWSDHGPVDPAKLWGRKGIGAGLGAICRLSDEFRYQREDDGNCFTVVVYRG